METLRSIYEAAAHNKLIQLVAIAIVTDTVFGVIRAAKERKFNSCFGINGAIRKIAMICTLVSMVVVDSLIKVNLIGFIPKEARDAMNMSSVGITEFFAILYIAYETVSILKNMVLCGLPVKRVWEHVRKVLSKYTKELPDTDEIDEQTAAEQKEEQQDKETS